MGISLEAKIKSAIGRAVAVESDNDWYLTGTLTDVVQDDFTQPVFIVLREAGGAGEYTINTNKILAFRVLPPTEGDAP